MFISLRFVSFILIIYFFFNVLLIHCLQESRDDHFSATSSPPKLCNTLLLIVSYRDNDHANIIWPYKSGSVKRGEVQTPNQQLGSKKSTITMHSMTSTSQHKKTENRNTNHFISKVKFNRDKIPSSASHWEPALGLGQFIISSSCLLIGSFFRGNHKAENKLGDRKEWMAVWGPLRLRKYTPRLYLNPIQLLERDLIYHAVFFPVDVGQPKLQQASRVLTSRNF